ncbi:MAG: Ldh family oxidoreductase [Planctomycetota bacterium]|jgi:LDH2 family malate/lactate/ureidoglycolate dehydrogenase
MTVRVPLEALERFARDVLVAAGASEDDAAQVAETLLWCDRCGKKTQGLSRLPILVRRLRAGAITTPAPMSLEKTAATTARLDAANGFGSVAGRRAMDEAVAMAREHGVGVCAIRHSNHYGASGFYAARAADAGMIGFSCSNALPKVAPHGGTKAALGTNPLGFACPRREGPPIVVDFATSASAGSTIRWALRNGLQLPPETALDKDGAATLDPAAVEAGGVLLPAAGPKGFGLALMIEVLSGVLTGAAVASSLGSTMKDLDRPVDCGQLCLAIDVARFVGRDEFLQRLETLVDSIQGIAPREGFETVRVPGAAGPRPGDLELPDDLVRVLEGLGAPTPWQ